METLWAGIDIGKASFVAATVAMVAPAVIGVLPATEGYAPTTGSSHTQARVQRAVRVLSALLTAT